MCVIVHQQPSQHLTKEIASTLWGRNPDGGGFAYVNNENTVQVEKHMHFGEFWRAFELARSNFPRRDFLLHMRIATHGSVSIDNVHPFAVNEHTVMAHNGIIHGVLHDIEPTDDRSDTRYFIDEVLPKLPPTWLDDKHLRQMVDEWVGWSKLMFLTTDPALKQRVYRLGKWDDWKGMPMSNTNGLHTIPPQTGGWTRGIGWEKTKESPNVYQLPLPKREEVTHKSTYQETSEEWEAWLDYKQQVHGEEEMPLLDDLESELLINAMKEQRASEYLFHPLIMIDSNFGQIECSQCLAPVDLETALCQCWDEICGECWRFLALCEGTCSGTRSYFEFANLTKEGQDFVLNGGRTRYASNDTNRKILAELFPEATGNTSENSDGSTG